MRFLLKCVCIFAVLAVAAVLLLSGSSHVDADSDVTIDGYRYELNGNEATVISLGAIEDKKVYEIPAVIQYDNNQYNVTKIGRLNNGSSGINSNGYGLMNVTQQNITHTNIVDVTFATKSYTYSVKINSDIEINPFAFYTELPISSSSTTVKGNASGLTAVDLNGHKVTAVGDYAFRGCEKLDDFNLSDCTSIGKYAFLDCKNFKSIVINCDIPEGAFYNNTSLTSITLKDGISIGTRAFQKNTSLLSFTANVTVVGELAFTGCSNLNSVSLSGLNNIESQVFLNDTKLESVSLTGTFTKISDKMFSGCSKLSNVSIPQSCCEIGDSAFLNACKSGNGFDMDLSNFTKIDSKAFSGAKLSSQLDLKSIQTVGSEAFKGTSVVSVIIGKACSSIGANAFAGSLLLTESTINADAINADSVFSGCTALTSVGMDGVTSIGPNVFKGCTSLSGIDLTGVESIGNSAFEGTGLQTITIPSSVTHIGSKTFYGCLSMTSASFDNTLQVIPESLFEGCKSLKTIKIPNGLKSLSSNSFKGTVALDIDDVVWDVTVEDVLKWPSNAFEESGVVKLSSVGEGSELGYYFIELKLKDSNSFKTASILVSVTNDLDSLGYDYVFQLPADLITIYNYNGAWTKVSISIDNEYYQTYLGVLYSADGKTLLKAPYCYDAESMLDTLEKIGTKAFSGTSLQVIYIPEGVTEIESYAFSGCTTLQSVSLPEGLKIIGERAFDNTQINRLSLPSSVETIGSYAFTYPAGSEVQSLEIEIPIDSNLKNVGAYAMKAEGSIFIPSTLQYVNGGRALFGTEITEVFLGSFVSEPYQLFQGCNNLKIYLPLGSNGEIASNYGSGVSSTLAGYYIISGDELLICNTKLSTNSSDYYFVSTVGDISPAWITDGQTFSLTSAKGYAPCDLIVTYGDERLPVHLSGGVYTIPDSDRIYVDERSFTTRHTVVFDSMGGKAVSNIFVGDGRSILAESIPTPYKDRSHFIGWFSDSACTQQYVFSNPVVEDLDLYAKWDTRDPILFLESGIGTITATIGNTETATDAKVQENSVVSMTFNGGENCEFLEWEVRVMDSVTYNDSTTLTINHFEHDTFVKAVYRYSSSSSRLSSISNVAAPNVNEEYSVLWMTENVLDNSGMVWTGHSSVPLIVGDYIYARAGTAINKYDSTDGTIVAHCSSDNVREYYHYLGYAKGMIFDYATGKAYDLDLKEIAYYAPQGKMMNVFSNTDCIFIYYEKDGKAYLSSYTLDLKKSGQTYDKELTNVVFSQYGAGGNSSLISDGYLWYVAAPGDQRLLISINLSNGELSDTLDLSAVDLGNGKTISGYYLDDGWLSCYDGKLYLTCYSRGLFNATVGDGTTGYVISVPISQGTFTKDSVKFTETGDMANSEFVVYKDRGYVNVGGQLRVYKISDMSIIYTAASSYTHGGIMINTSGASESNDWEVEIFLIPYNPTSELYVFKDSQNQTVPNLIIKKVNTLGAFNSQCVRLTESGKLIWYNDSGQLFCVGSTKDNKYQFFIDYGDEGIWYQSSGRFASDAFKNAMELAGIEYAVEDSTIKSLNGFVNGDSYWNTYLVNSNHDLVDLLSTKDTKYHTFMIVYGGKGLQGENLDTNKQWAYMDGGNVARSYILSSSIPADVIGKMMTVVKMTDTSTVVSGNSVSSTITINSVDTDQKVKVYGMFSDNSFMQIASKVKVIDGAATVEVSMSGNATPSMLLVSLTSLEGNQLMEYRIDLGTAR